MWHLAVDIFTLEMKPGWNIVLNLTWAYHLVPNQMIVHHLTNPLHQTQTLTMTVNTKTHLPGPFLAPVLAFLPSNSALLLLVVLTLIMTVDAKTRPPSPFLAPVLALLPSPLALLLLVVLEGEAKPSLMVLNSENNKNQMTKQKDKKLNSTPRNGNLRKMMTNLFK